MSETTIVTVYPSSVINSSDLTPGSYSGTVWHQPENALTFVDDYAYNAYYFATYPGGAASAADQSANLWFYNFGLSFPENAVFEGFKVNMRISGVKSRDVWLYLTLYNPDNGPTYIEGVEIQSDEMYDSHPSTPTTRIWGGYDETGPATYASIYPRVWTPQEVNSSYFGFYYKSIVYDTVGGFEMPSTKIYWTSMEIAYHLDETWFIPSGGISGSSSASVTGTTNAIISGGAKASGHNPELINITDNSGGAQLGGIGRIVWTETTSGGIGAGGSAQVTKPQSHVASGGSSLAGSAAIYQMFVPSLAINTFSVNCTGPNNVPPDDHNEVATALIRVDTTAHRLHFDIRHSMSGLDAVRLRGPATRTEIAPPLTQIRLEEIVSTTSPMIGSASITTDMEAEILAGLWYLFIREDTSQTILRGQIENGTVLLGGYANTAFVDITRGGMRGGGSASVSLQQIFSDPAPAISGGSAIVEIGYGLSSGANLAGSAVDTHVRSVTTSSQGIALSGIADAAMIHANIADAGAILSGTSLQGVGIGGSGGVSLGSSATDQKYSNGSVSGGLQTAGSYTLQQTYSNLALGGGPKIGGRARTEKIQNYDRFKIRVGHAFRYPPTGFTIQDTSTKVMQTY